MIRVLQYRAEQRVNGFQSPADDHLEGRLHIDSLLVIDPECTFYFRMASGAMTSHGIERDDLLVIDRSLQAVHGAVIVVVRHGAFRCVRLEVTGGRPALVSDAGTVKLHEDEPLEVWGVVTAICRNALPEALKTGRYAGVCTL